jgi:putative DNA primase/helicase
VVIPESERDTDLANKLRDEWPMILRWAVGGCIEWQRDGLQAPDEVIEATDSYRADMDVLGEFIEDRCTIGAQFTARASDLYHSYTQWCEARGEHKNTQTKFGARLAERGFRKGRGADGRKVYFGIGVLS